MKHFYENIHGWFDFHNLYSQIVESANDGDHFVEIGCWMGRSSSYMAVEIINSGKDIKFDCIDTWRGSKEHVKNGKFNINGQDVDSDWLYNEFMRNTEPVAHVINPIMGLSTDIAQGYDDKSVDFIFIDASHEYQDVLDDLKAWYPKLRDGGVIAGHDYQWVDVRRAVSEFFADMVVEFGSCWVVKVP